MIVSSTDIGAALRSRQRGFLLNPFRFGGGGGGSDPDVILRSTFNTAFTDVSPSGHSYTVNGGASISAAQSQFGGASAFFDGTGDEAFTNSVTASAVGSGDFTFEGWVYPQTQVNQFPICYGYSGGSGALYLQYNHSDSPGRFSVLAGTGIRIGTGTHATGSWYFVQVIRSGTTLTLYVNASSTASTTDSTNFGTTGQHFIGGRSGLAASTLFTGYVDDWRSSKVVRTVAVPTAEFPVN